MSGLAFGRATRQEAAKMIPGAYSELGHLYRYEYENYEDYFGGRLVIWQFPITKKTPCGVKIDAWGRERLILLDSRKKYACFTKQEALESFRARKQRQIRILNSQLDYAKDALELAEKEAPNGQDERDHD